MSLHPPEDDAAGQALRHHRYPDHPAKWESLSDFWRRDWINAAKGIVQSWLDKRWRPMTEADRTGRTLYTLYWRDPNDTKWNGPHVLPGNCLPPVSSDRIVMIADPFPPPPLPPGDTP